MERTETAAAVVRMRITSWMDPECHRTVELSDRATLYDVHQTIQSEFELGDDHLWAFFLSGEYDDPGTEFGTGEGARAPWVKLSELGLTAGMEIAYLFDFGSQFRHDVVLEAVEATESPPPASRVRVLERVGKPPPQYPVVDEDAVGEEDEDEEEDDDDDVAAPPLEADARSLEVLVASVSRMVDDGSALDPEERSRVLEMVGSILDACPSTDALDRASTNDDVEMSIKCLLDELRDEETSPELEALEWRLARLPPGNDRETDFDAELVANVRWALLRYAEAERKAADRVADIPREQLERICDAIVEACPVRARLRSLEAASWWGEIPKLLLDRLEVMAPEIEDVRLAGMIERTAQLLETPSIVRIVVANALSAAGEPDRARRVLQWFDGQTDGLDLKQRLGVAGALLASGEPGRAESLYRRVLERRWLSRDARFQAAKGLSAALRAQGKEEEGRLVERREAAHRREEDARRAGTVVRKDARVGRNDPCPCGSGKKAKKCCGAGG